MAHKECSVSLVLFTFIVVSGLDRTFISAWTDTAPVIGWLSKLEKCWEQSLFDYGGDTTRVSHFSKPVWRNTQSNIIAATQAERL